VKSHGALYNVASHDIRVARAIARGVARFDPSLILVGLANSALVKAAEEVGLTPASEGFCDRAYNADGTLRSRREPGAVHATPERAAAQAVQLARDHALTAYDGTIIALEVDTLCIHGDTPHAVEYARAIRRALADAGIEIKAM
ncbi:MAG: LamB/YcsF family protein, partial [Rudaea sp.]